MASNQGSIDTSHSTPREYAADDIDDELIEIPADSINTSCLIFARIRGIEFGLIFVMTVSILQILSILILGLTPKPDAQEMEFEHRNWAVFTALFLFVIACFAEFFDQNLLNIGVTFNVRRCYVVGRFSSKWMDFECLNCEFNKNAVKYDMNKCYVFCIVFVVIEVIVWLSVLVVGARLLVQSTSLQDVILNALAAVFVLEVDDLMGRMTLSIGGKWKENKYFALKRRPNGKELDLRPFPTIGGYTLYFLWLMPIVPTAVSIGLFVIPYW